MNTQSQIFDFGRFVKTMRRDFSYNRRQIAVKILVMLGLMTIGMLFIGMLLYKAGGLETFQRDILLGSVFFFGASLFLALGASSFMSNMSTPGERLDSLMEPSSTLEKYVSRFLIFIIGTTVAYIICFMISNLIRVWVFNTYFEGRNVAESCSGIMSLISVPTVLAVISNQATFLLGAAVWPRNSFLKTFGAMWVFQAVITVVCVVTFRIAVGEGPHNLNQDLELDTIKTTGLTLFNIYCVVTTLFCYITAYFRMRESEIIHRM